ncbi:ABC transporter ATP-binding protein [Paenibacillus agricola]|uniref:ATP-binding cassette domain-containing protein n=1 Tax=Paenibacillus agricola TaxID=2716264 RepID=A0ABX0J4Z8_9BACL|nr:ATP-binding cassette domain-containing protein [Paenibacillus agricola]NHN30723.1 ATP-binding cassette domain-containing protein [Paenibacillus agricola]
MQQVISLSNIHFIREERAILSEIELHVQQGEHWVILGKNGSGKTTILELINGYQFPSKGEVQVLDHIYGQCDVREVRKQIGYISQSLYEKLNPADPVWEVIATGEYAFLRFYQEISPEVRTKALGMLDEIRLSHLANQPLGTLSQGERKKVMLARALMTSPSILILDEPCSGLDLYERERLLETVNQLGKQNITVLYVTHHIEEIMPMFTHVALIDEGRLVASGRKEDVLNEDNLLKAFQVPVSLEWFQGRPWIKVL